MAFFTAIGAAIFGAGTFLAGVATAVLKLAVGIGMNLLAQSLAGKQKGPEFSINGSLQGGGDLPRSIIFGEYSTAGSLVWTNTWGEDGDTKNAYLTQVIALSDFPVKGLLEFWVNGEKVSLEGSNVWSGYTVPEYRKDGDNLWIRFYDGTQTTAEPFLIASASNANRSWDASRVGRGVAYAIVTARVSKQMFSGMPTFKFTVDGARLYDISRDSSRGGVGTQRWADPATWGGDGDYLPVVQMYNILMGLRYNGSWLYGFQGMAQARLNDANWISQINKCRSTINGASGPEPTYRSGMELPVDVASSGAFEALLSACQGKIADVGGVFHIYCGEPEAPDFALSDDDIIVTTGQSFTPFFPLADSINGISAKWPSREDGWNVKTAPPLYRTDLEVLHGGRRLMADVELTAVPYAEQVQRLMRSSLLTAQRARRHTMTIGPKFWAYCVPGAVFSWTSVRNGYVSKLFQIDGVVDGANLEVMIDVTEVDPADYSWNSSTDYTPPVDGALGPMRPAPMPIVGFGALPGVVQDSNGNNRRCAIELFWDGSLTGIDFVDYEVRLASNLSYVDTGRAIDFSRGSILVAPGTLLPNTGYQVRGCYGTYDGNSPFEWSAWIPVTTLDIRLGPLDIYPFDVESFNRDVTDMWKWQNDALRYVQEELDRQGKIMADGQAGTYKDRQQLRRELTSTAEGVTASYVEAITAATGPGSALVNRIETLSAKVDNDIATAINSINADISTIDGKVTANSSDITSLQIQMGNKAEVSAVDALTTTVTNQGNTITAQGNSITGLTTSVGRFSANGLFRVTTEATPSGALSRIGLSASATEAGSTVQAAMFIDAMAGGVSRIVMNADQIFMTNGTNSAAPFSFIGGQATMMLARVNEITAGTLRSPNNNVTFNLTAGTLIFRDNT